MKKNFLKRFLICGCIGWLLECLWTGFCSLIIDHNHKLNCHTSLWMFPIYGLACFIHPLSKKLHKFNALIRGGVYAILIFTVEFITGVLLTKFGACPWDYSDAKYNYKGVIRFDFFPLWFVVGLFYEKILKR